MKRIRIRLRIAVCVLFMLSSLSFAAVGGWQLFSEDWKLFENESLALAQVIGKILLCLYCFAVSLYAVLQWKQSCLWEGIQLLGMTLVAAPFISNHLGMLFVVFAVLFLILEPGVWRYLFGRQKKRGKRAENPFFSAEKSG